MPVFRPRSTETDLRRDTDNGSRPTAVEELPVRAQPVPTVRIQPTPKPANPAADQKRVGEEQHALLGRVRERLLRQLDTRFEAEVRDSERLQRHIANAVDAILLEDNLVLPQTERVRILQRVQADVTGLGPLEELLADDSVTEIMVNGPHELYIERGGKIHESAVRFHDEVHVRRVIERIVAPLGRRVNESSPMVDARLSDGSRVNIVIPPIALNGSTITIRKFSKKPFGPADLIRVGGCSAEVMEFLRLCVMGRMNIIVTGGTGAGKTTLLNVLSSFIPEDERIVTIENAAELQLQQRHVITLESRPANIEGKGEVSIRDLVVNSLRMRPNRIVVGECRSGETLDMLQAMNTGHDGSMTTIHANNPRDALRRLETMVLMAGLDLPVRAIREQVSAAVNLIAHVDRFPDGSRRVSRVCEVLGMETDVITMSDIFVFRQNGMEGNRIVGELASTGIRPRLLETLKDQNLDVSTATFGFVGSAR
ncbi:MAG TPA: CpaF family protein [Herpetosiphonaceae bacterium]|nr:CpaF family protein [Herpetosiphonaceae bacterium]